MKEIDYQTYKKPSDFIRFNQGNTRIVLISKGYLMKKHGMRTANGYVPLGDCTETPDCPFCLKGNDPKQKWIWIAYIPEEKKVGILDVGAQIGDSICQQAKKTAGALMKEVNIHKEGEMLKTKYIATLGKQITLTKEEVDFVEPYKSFLVNKYFKK